MPSIPEILIVLMQIGLIIWTLVIYYKHDKAEKDIRKRRDRQSD